MKKPTYHDSSETRSYPPHKEASRHAMQHTPSPSLVTKSSLSDSKKNAEIAQLKELEALVRQLMDRVPLPQVWDNRLHKQLTSIEKMRAELRAHF